MTTTLDVSADSAKPAVHDRVRFRHDIEGLRAIAVLLVALNHAHLPHLSGGFVGVDVFFVISGFLITGLLLGEVERRGRVSIADFYARRVRRILPLSALVAVVTMVSTYDIAGTAVGNRTAADGGWTAVFLANVHFAASGVDYFNRGALPSPLQHFWSLGVEEQFYVLWPLMILVIGLLVASLRTRRTVTIAVIATACVLSLAWSIHLTGSSPTAAYFSPFTRAFELGIGALLASAVRSRRLLLSYPAAAVTAIAGLAMIAASVLLFDESTAFPGVAALLPTVGTALVILGGTDNPDGPASRAIGILPMRFIGSRSYGFYLWHFPFLILPAAALGHDPSTLAELGLVAAAFATACLTYTFIEDPVRHSEWLRTSRPAVSLALGAALIAGVLGVSQFLQISNAVTYTQPAAAPAATLPGSDGVRAAVAAAVGTTTAPADLDPPADGVAEFGQLTPEESACDRPYDATRAEECFLGDTSSTDTVVLWGDSHASMWTPALSAVAEQAGKRLAVYAKYGCAPLLGVTPWHPTEDRAYDECPKYKDSALPSLLALNPSTVILTGAFRGWDYSDAGRRVSGGDYTAAGEWVPTSTVDGVWDDALARTIKAVEASGAKVIVLGDSAYPLSDGAVCLSAHATDLTTCATPASTGAFATHNAAEKATAERNGATYVPVTPWFCTARVCPPVVADTAVYRDQYHMTRQYSLYLSNAVGRATGLLPAGG